jgi:asparagine synthetase B (glutamine-hydrolysing)
MVNPMFVLAQKSRRSPCVSLLAHLLQNGPTHLIEEAQFQLRWGDANSIQQQQTSDGFRLDLVAQPFGHGDALLSWHGPGHGVTVTRPWPGRVSVYLSKDRKIVSSHLRFFAQMGQAITPAPVSLAPGTNFVLGPARRRVYADDATPLRSTQKAYSSIGNAALELREALRQAVGGLPAEAVVLLSGGIDSAAIAAAAPTKLRCLTWTSGKASSRSTDASDLQSAQLVAEHLGVPHDILYLSPVRLHANLDLAVLLGEVRRGTLIDDLVVYIEVARALRRQGVKTVVIGEAADDAFGCLPIYLRFFQGPDLLNKLRGDYELGAPADYSAIAKVFGAFGIEAVDPYLSAPVAAIVQRLPLDMRVDRARLMKPILRHAFREELPESIVNRPKRVSRDVSGVRILMEERFGRSRERFLPIFDALFRDRDAPARQRELLAGLR